MPHQFTIVSDAAFTARFDEKLQLITAHAQGLRDILSGNEIAHQHRLFIYEMKTGHAVLVRLRIHRLVADAADEYSRGHDDGDVGGCAVGGVIMKRKPT